MRNGVENSLSSQDSYPRGVVFEASGSFLSLADFQLSDPLFTDIKSIQNKLRNKREIEFFNRPKMSLAPDEHAFPMLKSCPFYRELNSGIFSKYSFIKYSQVKIRDHYR